MLSDSLKKIPKGYSQVRYKNKKYGLTKSIFNAGKSIKIFGQELGGNDFISLNFYSTKNKELLIPCEMPRQKVVHFLENLSIDATNFNTNV